MKKALKLKHYHPRNAYQVGRHTITRTLTNFDLNESEEKELKAKGGKHWVHSEEAIKEKEVKKKPVKKVKKD